jgi:Domain of unknown function (DUF4105)
MMAGPAGLHGAALILASVFIAAAALWCALALRYRGPGNSVARVVTLALWVLFSCAALLALRSRYAALGGSVFVLAFALVLLWWCRLKPSNDRPWADDVARTLSGELEGDTAVLHNVRDFEWRSACDYLQRWETRRYDLRQLRSVDLITSYWDIPGVAHILTSFGFADGRYLAFSVEIRRQRGQSFSALGGFFKAFELSVIAADERDVVRVRTNIRREDDYLFHLRLPVSAMRSLFRAYVEQANRLVSSPRFYNTVTVNCTTLVYHMMRHIVGRLPYSLRLVFSGFLPGYVHSVGGLDPRYSLAQLRAFGRITVRARQADRSPSFSQDIRAGIPALPPPDALVGG